MFNFVVKYLGFLKHVPGLGLLFDVWLRAFTLLTKPQVLDCIDEIEHEMLQLPGVTKCLHKYGGVQFNFNHVEIGHIHGNGLLDMLLSRHIKRKLIADGRVQNHHIFNDTGWVSFYIENQNDKQYALKLLQISLKIKANKGLNTPGGYHQTALPAVVPVFAQVNALPNTKCQPAISNGNGN